MTMIAATALVYQGVEIRDRGEMLSLTDMWRAAGEPEGLRPANWTRQERTQKRVNFLVESTVLDKHSECFQAVNESGEWNTWAHWALAIEYAEDLSVEMWFWAKTAVRESISQGQRHRQRPPGL